MCTSRRSRARLHQPRGHGHGHQPKPLRTGESRAPPLIIAPQNNFWVHLLPPADFVIKSKLHIQTATQTPRPSHSQMSYFGLDLSTQQLKLLVTDGNLNVTSSYSLEFEKELPHYKTRKGVFSVESTGEIMAPVAMWIEALDLVLTRMKDRGFDFSTVKGISGSGQQHGSVFWSQSAPAVFASLDPGKMLKEQIDGSCFAIETSPNWQDHSTGEELKVFENYTGGAERLAEITGSRAHYRFTGPQIRKLLKNKPEVYSNTTRISLVSSFLASLFAGSIVEIEEGEACGMNLYDIGRREWNEDLLAICSMSHESDGVTDLERRTEAVETLKAKLGTPSPVGYKNISKIAPYFVTKYGFDPECHIFSFTGDNLATIISLPLAQDEILISLGTSTTALLVTKHYVPSSSYHTFIHPTIPESYMGMICYCNGALAREKVRDLLNEKAAREREDWTLFDELLSKSHFEDRLGVFFPLGEIVPNRKAQTLRAKLVDGHVEIVDSWDVEIDVGTIVQSQALSCRARAAPMLSVKRETVDGINTLEFDGKPISKEHLSQRPHKVVFVGGASKNSAIVQKMGEILGGDETLRFDNPNACALGGAFKASWGVYCEEFDAIGFHEYLHSRFDDGGMDKIDIDVKQWDEYIPGLTMLKEMEDRLER